MIERTELSTHRLRLRPFKPEDAADIEHFIGDHAVAATTIRIPHPYPPGGAIEWIATHDAGLRDGTGINFAIIQRGGDRFTGAIGLGIEAAHRHAELGYWVAVPFWRQGFATEAARAVVDYGFRRLSLHRIFAHHMSRNVASGRVLTRAGMRHEGTIREHILKWGEFVDLEHYGILRDEWAAAVSSRT